VQPTASPTPSPTPTGLTGDLASTLCIAGSTYTLGDHDWFDRDSSLSVSDTWPESGGAEWSDQFSFGRTNNAGTDDAYYPSQAQVAAWGVQPVAVTVPGVGLELKSYPVTNPSAAETTALKSDGTLRGHLSGMLTNSKSYVNGYWVYSVQLPGGNGWWPAVWLLNEAMNGSTYQELDTEEQWGPETIGANVVQQTQQCGSGANCSNQIYQRTTVGSSDTAQHTYATIATPSYVGFYIDGAATTAAYPRYTNTGLNPILNLQVCTPNSYCPPAPAATATAQMIVKYYAYYAPPPTPAPCGPPYDVPALK
jgi:beta-glucanase (GH16 family)